MIPEAAGFGECINLCHGLEVLVEFGLVSWLIDFSIGRSGTCFLTEPKLEDNSFLKDEYSKRMGRKIKKKGL
jgi:hypothetical protein